MTCSFSSSMQTRTGLKNQPMIVQCLRSLAKLYILCGKAAQKNERSFQIDAFEGYPGPRPKVTRLWKYNAQIHGLKRKQE